MPKERPIHPNWPPSDWDAYPFATKADAARWLQIPYSTMKRWAKGKDYLSMNDLRDLSRIRHSYNFFTRKAQGERSIFIPQPGVEIDPAVRFGKPTAAGTSVHTAVLAQRHAAGESIKELADDYNIKPDIVQAAIRFEQNLTKREKADA